MSAEPTLEQQSALAAHHFPVQWRSAKRLTGEKGRKVRATWRKRAVAEAIMVELRKQNARCGNCANRGRFPDRPAQMTCDLDSDFHGYALTTADGLCHRWSPEATASEPATTPETGA